MLKMQKLDQLLQKETIDKSKAYQAEYQVQIEERKRQTLSMMLTKEDYEKVINNEAQIEEEDCCNQCHLKTPLECWRSVLLKNLQKIKVQSQCRDIAFIKLDEQWRDRLAEFIKSHGSQTQDKSWQMKFFNFCQQKKTDGKQQNGVFSAAQNESIISQNKNIA